MISLFELHDDIQDGVRDGRCIGTGRREAETQIECAVVDDEW